MALKADTTNPMDYLNKLLADNGIEVVLPEEDEEKEIEDEEEKEDKE